MTTTCSWAVVRDGIEEPCDKPAVAWSRDPREEFAYCDPFPVCPAHTRVGIALPLDDRQVVAFPAVTVPRANNYSGSTPRGLYDTPERNGRAS